ncbi:helix-turn-helix domain-containing protein [Sediminicola luteus]|nr:helix-turn-helix domain-containing protein [Sediminicola luteus]
MELGEIIGNSLTVSSALNLEALEGPLYTLFKEFRLDEDVQRFDRFVSNQVLGKGLMNAFGNTLAITQKSFIQKFKKDYLLTPNTYVKLKLINTSIQRLETSRFGSLTELALDAGFYDQSHFIRNFKKFCGCSPKQYRSPSLG